MRNSHTFILLLMVVALAGCGIKPAKLKAPDASQEDHFPQTYPDISTDPRPE
jgi:hypothetical protein